jgi:DNA polymerase elongation subunit (family B)
MNARAEIDEDSNLGEVSKNEKLPHGVYKKNKPQILKLGGEMERYYPTVMWGKHITDCLFSVRRAQALDSNMKKATLKYVTKYSKIAKKNRVYLNGKIINKTWADTTKTYAFNNENGDWYKTSETKPLKEGYELVTGRYIAERYLLDDIWETDKVELRYNESNFLVGKMLPVKFQRMCTMGTATIWKYIMLAWSYEHDLAIPLETSSRSFTGGLSRLLTVGYIPNVQKLDYNSLYPSIILTFGIKTAIDISGAMPAMLEYVLTNREYYKALKGKYGKEAKSLKKQIEKLVKDMAPDAEIKILQEKQFEADSLSMRNDKMQLPLKITGNAFFGSFGAGGGIFYWSDMDCAEETTCCGRQMLRLMLKWFTDIGYEGIVCDTDGMNFRQPPTFRYTEEHPYVSTGMNRNTEKDKKYVGPWGDLAEFNDLFMRVKNGLDIDEFVPSSCYIARKNYMDLLDVETQKVKLVGNTIKSKKMPIYIEKFIDDSVRDLLNDRGKDYLDKYYDKIDEIYNLRIPLKDIASVGKIKMSIEEYKESCKQRTKAGTKKARQAWYELAIKHNLDVHMGDAVYYINTGTKKGESDVKRVTHYCVEIDNEKVDKTKEFKKEWETLKKQAKDKASQEWQTAQNKLTVAGQNKLMNLDTYVATYHPEAWDEDELIFNCVLVPNDIIEDEEDHYCDDEFEYNVAKYINTFNSRIRPQLVCFDRKIRTRMVQNKKGEWVEENNILITDPKDRKYFTVEEAKEVSGQPYKETDQDTYEQLMTMEDKEIRFWISVNKEPVYWRECGMDWEAIKKEYLDRMEMLKKEGIRQEAELFQKLVSKVTYKNIIDLIEESIIPEQFLEFCDLDPKTGNFISKKWDIKLGSLYDIIDAPVDEDADDEEEPTENTFAGV